MKYTIASSTWRPARLNQLLGHWAKGAKLKKRDRQIVAVLARIHEVPPATGKRRVTLTVQLGPRERGADVDAFFKSLCDSLVHAGLLRGDSKEWCELAPVQYVRGGAGCVIELEDLP